jgi:pseudaminic acid synthase
MSKRIGILGGKMNKCIDILGRKIGIGCPTYIISELSANHLHDLDLALKVVEESAKAGVDAIKVQTLTPDTMTIDCEKPDFIVNDGTLWDGKKLYDLYSDTPLPYQWHEPIFKKCEELGLHYFSTPYDISALEFLDKFDLPAYKVSSFEINDLPLIREIARRGKPIIISTGIADITEIHEAVQMCLSVGNDQIALLKCTSSYPAPYDSMNLLSIPNIRDTFNVVAGLSDHSLGIEVPIASVVLGASIIEKHVTIDRNLGGPDSEFSLEPDELKQMVTSIRNVEKALGKVSYEVSEQVKRNKKRFGRSLYIVEDIKKGEQLSDKNMRSIRPGFGLSPKHYDAMINKKVNRDVEKGTPLSWEIIDA